MPLTLEQQSELFAFARESIELGLATGTRAAWDKHIADPALNESRATFVTLRKSEDLRGCCGTLRPLRPLAQDVWHNAWVSAFADPRFMPLTQAEYPQLHLHISMLTAMQPLTVASEAVLLQVLRPHVDGLVLTCHGSTATFLPSVWEQIASPREFVTQLKRKAGWTDDFWSAQMRIERYQSEDFAEL